MSVYIWFLTVSFIFISTAYYLPYIILLKKMLSELKQNNRDNLLNGIFTFLIGVSVYVFMLIFYAQLAFRSPPDEIMFLSFLYIPMIILWIAVNITTLLYRFFGNPDKLKAYKERIKNELKENLLLEDTKRKTFHLIFFFGLLIGTIIAVKIAISIIPQWGTPKNYYGLWEYNPDKPSDKFYFIKLLGNMNAGIYFPWVHFLLLMIFLVMGYIFIVFEAVRHSRFFYFPTDLLLVRFLRQKEFDSFASYIYFFISMIFAVIILPPLFIFAVIGVFSVGDMLASQIGIRLGKRRIKINPKKKWEGTVAGTIGSFFAASIFVGPIYGIASAVVFMIIDILCEHPINISDNLSIPIVLTLVYTLMNLAGVPYHFPPFLILIK